MKLAFFVFAAAGATDALDGFLAKRFGWRTELGAYLDPLADKLLLVSIYIVLGLAGHLPVWLVIAVVSRDLLIVGAFLLTWILDRPLEVRPLLISKANTASQIVLAALVLVNVGFALGWLLLIQQLVWITGALTILSAAFYLVAWLRQMSDYEETRRPAAAPSSFKPDRAKARESRRAKEQATGS